MRGEIPNYIEWGGRIGMKYNSKRWKDLRLRALKRDAYMCQECKRYGKRIDADMVHHIYPSEDYPEWQWRLWNLTSLCNKCHEQMHDRDTRELTDRGMRLQQKTIPPTP